ncbi:DnaD domain-containing protein [Alkalicoccus urumqiensis]|nr:DnaD domain protein [Alkalicoccus urumqiensis]
MKPDQYIQLLEETPFQFPAVLFRTYLSLGLDDMQFLMLMHVHQFKQEGEVLPSPAQLASRMSTPEKDCSRLLSSLLSARFIEIKETQQADGTIEEFVSLKPLYEKLGEWMNADEPEEDMHKQNQGNLFRCFEEEFARPLSPMEIEMISMWLDEDGHSVELIEGALKESVISSRLNFRYIDRILHEWKRNGIRSLQEAKKHGENVRRNRHAGEERKRELKTPPGYNWLEGGVPAADKKGY